MCDRNIYSEALDRAGWSAEDGGTSYFIQEPRELENEAASIANDILYTIELN